MMIPLVPVPGTLATSYGSAGKTRDGTGRPWRYDKLVRVETFARSRPELWKCTPGMARDLVRLDESMKERGSGGLRITELRRMHAFQAAERAKYDTWVAAGRPDPGTRGYHSSVMRTTYMARAGESNHEWGAALDVDVFALDFPDTHADSQLSVFWDLAEDVGFRPVIAHPERDQAEAWHFDHLGPLIEVYDLFRDQGRKAPEYRRAYALTALTGCILTGVYQGANKMEHLLQARLLVAGHWVGKPDGKIGPKTMAGLEAAGVKGATRSTPAAVLLGALDEMKIGHDELAAA